MKIYLAGSVPKGKQEESEFYNWRVDYADKMSKFIDAEFLDPIDREIDESNSMEIVGHDCKMIKECDLVVVNATKKLGAGTSQEMVVAKYFKKPVVTVLPKDTHHRRSNIIFYSTPIEDWIHPFINVFSDFVVESVEGIEKIKDNLFTTKPKDITIVDDAVNFVS
jgi:nucleoside 2-deoxyribosyltransferase